MEARTRVLVVPVALVLGAVAFAAVLTPCTSRLSANPGQNGAGGGRAETAGHACPVRASAGPRAGRRGLRRARGREERPVPR